MVYLQALIIVLSSFPLVLLAQDSNLRQVKESFNNAHIPEDLFIDFEPSILLEVSLPQASGPSITLHAGVQLPRNETAGPPTFSIVGESAGRGPFVIAAVDPDAPTPQTPTSAQIRHFLGGDFTAGRGRISSHQLLTNSTPAISSFRQPTPPAGSPAHRYIFLLFKQPRGFDEQNFVNSTTPISMFNISQFAIETGLGKPIGGTFMLVAPA